MCWEGEDEDGDDNDPALPKAKKHLCSHSSDIFSSSDLFSSNSSTSVDSQNCPASSNPIGHHQNLVADNPQKHQETGKKKQRKGYQKMEKRQKHMPSKGWSNENDEYLIHQSRCKKSNC